jgi:hypothetical protein
MSPDDELNVLIEGKNEMKNDYDIEKGIKRN